MRTQKITIGSFTRWAWCLIVLCGIAAALPTSASAQMMAAGKASPQAEVSIDYSYVRANSAGGGNSFNLQGGSASFTFYFHKYLGLVADVGGYDFGGQPAGLSAQMYTFMFGPRVTLRKSFHFSPYAQTLFGGGRLNASTSSVQAGENAFVMSLGGGIDIGLTHHIAIRAVQGEYLMTRFANIAGISVTQNNFRISAGVVFRFGSH
jgi:hypothetical protein